MPYCNNDIGCSHCDFYQPYACRVDSGIDSLTSTSSVQSQQLWMGHVAFRIY